MLLQCAVTYAIAIESTHPRCLVNSDCRLGEFCSPTPSSWRCSRLPIRKREAPARNTSHLCSAKKPAAVGAAADPVGGGDGRLGGISATICAAESLEARPAGPGTHPAPSVRRILQHHGIETRREEQMRNRYLTNRLRRGG